jgi:hypothetical protein
LENVILKNSPPICNRISAELGYNRELSREALSRMESTSGDDVTLLLGGLRAVMMLQPRS